MRTFAFTVLALLVTVRDSSAADFPKPDEGDAILKDFKFTSSEKLSEIKIHYRTLAKPVLGKDGKIANAVLILHGTGGSGTTFIEGKGGDLFGRELFGKGQPLDAERFYLVIPDNLGHGKSSKPSNGQHARFPKYGYEDMISAQHRLLTEALKINHLRLVLGTSMGGMHAWLWGQRYPEFMDAIMPLASLPTEMSGRNRMWRKLICDAIRTDPEWKNGDYEVQPRSLRTVAQMLFLMSSNPMIRQNEAPTMKKADEVFDKEVTMRLKGMDANDVLYAVESSWDYNPGPGMKKIRAPLLAINFADDLINPPELGILEREVKSVPNGKAMLLPASEETIGHGTHTKATIWKQHLEKFLKDTER